MSLLNQVRQRSIEIRDLQGNRTAQGRVTAVKPTLIQGRMAMRLVIRSKTGKFMSPITVTPGVTHHRFRASRKGLRFDEKRPGGNRILIRPA